MYIYMLPLYIYILFIYVLLEYVVSLMKHVICANIYRNYIALAMVPSWAE